MRDDQFERLYEDHAQSLYGFLVYRTGDRGLSEDLLADTFERILRSKHSFDPRRGSEKTWLYTIAMNCARDHHRRSAAEGRALERVAVASTGPGTSPATAIEDRDAVRRGLEELSPNEREVIALRYGADLRVPEIAELTGEKLTTVEGRVYRALRKLRDKLS